MQSASKCLEGSQLGNEQMAVQFGAGLLQRARKGRVQRGAIVRADPRRRLQSGDTDLH